MLQSKAHIIIHEFWYITVSNWANQYAHHVKIIEAATWTNCNSPRKFRGKRGRKKCIMLAWKKFILDAIKEKTLQPCPFLLSAYSLRVLPFCKIWIWNIAIQSKMRKNRNKYWVSFMLSPSFYTFNGYAWSTAFEASGICKLMASNKKSDCPY